jgi:hypothetical protein
VAISVSTWVWDHSKSRHGARLVLLRIADGMRTADGWTWPSVRELAVKANLTERAVRAAITELAGLGELDVQYNAGPGGCNRYRVVTPAKFSGVQSFQGADSSPLQDLHPSESPQATGHTPEDSSPPEKTSPLKKTTPTPENFAGGTVMNHEDSTSPLKDSVSTGEPGALFGEAKPAKPKPVRQRASATGTRIPDDFAIDADMRKWAAEKIPGFDIDAETENFIDYWRQRADKGALKADWVATWRTWMRRAAKDAGTPQPARNSNGSGGGNRQRSNVIKQTNYADEEYASGW